MERRNLTVFVVALVVGYWLASSPSSPLPSPSPEPSRPVARWFARAAKNLLWFALIAEKPPADPQPDHHVARFERVGDDGYPVIQHGRGW